MFFLYLIIRTKNPSDFLVFLVEISPPFIVGCIVFSIVLWVKSNNEQRGTLTFYGSENRIVSRVMQEVIEIKPDQISEVLRNGNLVKIVFSGTTLTLVSDRAVDIVNAANEMIRVCKQNPPVYQQTAANRIPVQAPVQTQINPDEIRKYKQLVDDGIITQEQFDQIIKQNF